jgi:endonuclease/exonuclease/phosphatase family metal-dependent hydrolase
MKPLLLFPFLFLPLLLFTQSLSFMSFNIRYDNPGDEENLWKDRKEKVADLILFHQPTVIGLQEALRHQVMEVDELLRNYRWVGVGRDDGKTKGEYVPIFYDQRRLKLMESGHFWLSETPAVPGSMSWGTACTRMVTYGSFEDLESELIFWFFNTHFDHVSAEARMNSARLLADRIQLIAGESPAIISGDFNCRLESPAGDLLLSAFKHPAALSEHPIYGPDFSYKPFDHPGQSGNVIDHLFFFQFSGVQVLRYGILSDNWNGKYPSDHLPVLTEIRLY